MRDAGHRTPDAGRRTSDIGHRTAKKAKIIYPPPRGVDIITRLLKMSKCELPLKVLQMANFSQITHSPTFRRAFT